jgi:hypothetical protein
MESICTTAAGDGNGDGITGTELRALLISHIIESHNRTASYHRTDPYIEHFCSCVIQSGM